MLGCTLWHSWLFRQSKCFIPQTFFKCMFDPGSADGTTQSSSKLFHPSQSKVQYRQGDSKRQGRLRKDLDQLGTITINGENIFYNGLENVMWRTDTHEHIFVTRCECLSGRIRLWGNRQIQLRNGEGKNYTRGTHTHTYTHTQPWWLSFPFNKFDQKSVWDFFKNLVLPFSFFVLF